VELRESCIAVVTICPGYIATPMTEHNPYRMPFLMQPDVAARRIARAIARRKRFYVLPWQLALAGRVFRALPRPLYARMFANAPDTPRRSDW
jgi:short-subunit dehydrogenase